jgi:flagellar capping protein FliD
MTSFAFVSGKPTEEEPGAGMLAKDSMVNTARRKLQNMLVTQVKGTDTYTALSQVGVVHQQGRDHLP